MAPIRQEEIARTARTITLADRVHDLERQARLSVRGKETAEKTKQFKFPFKWRRRFMQAKKKRFSDLMLVIYFNKKNEIEPPKFMPIYDGNMVIWKNKPYEFDPRAIWRIKGVRGQPFVYCIKEIDRRPIRNKDNSFKRDKTGRKIYSTQAAISNNDVDEIRARGDSTESDEFLIKAALKAQTSPAKKQMNVVVLVVILAIVAGGLIWFFTSS